MDLRETNSRRPMCFLRFAILTEVVDDGLVLQRLFGGARDTDDLRKEGHAQVVVLDGRAAREWSTRKGGL